MRHVRPKLAWALASALGLLVVAALAGAIEGGPLDPPGPPASTDGVLRPGTPISALPITLNQPGSYYLTHNLASASSGITITADYVTVDLGGFRLAGPGTSGTAISIAESASGTRIRNGSISSWQKAIEQVFSDDPPPTTILIEGIDVTNTASIAINVIGGATIRDCSVTSAGGRAIHVSSPGALIERCRVTGAVGVGISVAADAIVRDCEVSGVTATAGGDFGIFASNGSVVEGCLVHDNAENGIGGQHIRNVVVESNAGVGISLSAASTATNCISRNNGGTGITAGDNARIENCVSESNGGDGIAAGLDSVVHASTAGNNLDDGIVVANGSIASDNTAADNSHDGIEAAGATRILSNVLRFNGDATAGTADGAGIHTTGQGNYVEGNDLTSNDIGIQSGAGPNVIVRNTARNHTGGHFVVQASDLLGVLITLANHATTSLAHYNYTP